MVFKFSSNKSFEQKSKRYKFLYCPIPPKANSIKVKSRYLIHIDDRQVSMELSDIEVIET